MKTLLKEITEEIRSFNKKIGIEYYTEPILCTDGIIRYGTTDEPGIIEHTIYEVRSDGKKRHKGTTPGCFFTDWV